MLLRAIILTRPLLLLTDDHVVIYLIICMRAVYFYKFSLAPIVDYGSVKPFTMRSMGLKWIFPIRSLQMIFALLTLEC